jgi:hypothetical protein
VLLWRSLGVEAGGSGDPADELTVTGTDRRGQQPHRAGPRSPVVCCDSSMKLSRPVRMVLTLHSGFQLSGWNDDMLQEGSAGGRVSEKSAASRGRQRRAALPVIGTMAAASRLRHSLVLTAKRPLGVIITMAGGLKGYSGGKVTFPACAGSSCVQRRPHVSEDLGLARSTAAQTSGGSYPADRGQLHPDRSPPW